MKNILLIITLILTLPLHLSAQVGFSSTKQPGLQIYKAKTVNGTVTVNLPDKMYAGETITGTVIAEPKSSPKAKKEQLNKAIMLAQSLVIFGKRLNLDQQTFQVTVPENLKVGEQLIQLESENEILGQTTFNVLDGVRPPIVADQLSLPQFLRSGEFQNIPGSFDGLSNNTQLMLNNLAIPVVAESPGEVVTMIPENISGRQNLSIKEGDSSFSREIGVVNLDLNAETTNLRKGQQTAIHLNITGLSNISAPVHVVIDNQTPMSVSMTGGNHQEWTINPSEVDASGTFHRDLNIVASATGGYAVTALISEPTFTDSKKMDGDEPEPQPVAGGICGNTRTTPWTDTGKTVKKLDESEKTETRRNRSKCPRCGKTVDWIYYQIPEYEYIVEERFKYSCSLPKGHSNYPASCHGTSVKETKNDTKKQPPSVTRKKEIREGSCGCTEDLRWIKGK